MLDEVVGKIIDVCGGSTEKSVVENVKFVIALYVSSCSNVEINEAKRFCDNYAELMMNPKCER